MKNIAVEYTFKKKEYGTMTMPVEDDFNRDEIEQEVIDWVMETHSDAIEVEVESVKELLN